MQLGTILSSPWRKPKVALLVWCIWRRVKGRLWLLWSFIRKKILNQPIKLKYTSWECSMHSIFEIFLWTCLLSGNDPSKSALDLCKQQCLVLSVNCFHRCSQWQPCVYPMAVLLQLSISFCFLFLMDGLTKSKNKILFSHHDRDFLTWVLWVALETRKHWS